MPSTDVVWVDDNGGAPDLPWDTSQAASGTRSISRPYEYNGRHVFNIGQIFQPIAVGDKLLFYLYLDPCAPASQINVSGWSNGSVVYAFWGAPSGDDPANAVNAGPLPAAGSWQRLEVAASALGLEGQTLDTLTFTNLDGRMWLDHIGKSQ
jgi:hypothetical protein